MPRFGFHSGEAKAKRVKSGGKYCPNAVSIPLKTIVGNGAVISGQFVSALPSGVQVFGWDKITTGVDDYITIQTITPSNVPGGAKAKINLFWFTSGTNVSQSVVWDADIKTTVVQVSGVPLYYIHDNLVSGTTTAATTTAQLISGAYVLQKAQIASTAAIVKPNAMLMAKVYRDGDETADTLIARAYVVGVELEYSD